MSKPFRACSEAARGSDGFVECTKVGADGSGLEKMKAEAKLQALQSVTRTSALLQHAGKQI